MSEFGKPMSATEAQIYLDQFDERFIHECKKSGLNAEQARLELLNNEYRQSLVKHISDLMSLRTAP